MPTRSVLSVNATAFEAQYGTEYGTVCLARHGERKGIANRSLALRYEHPTFRVIRTWAKLKWAVLFEVL